MVRKTSALISPPGALRHSQPPRYPQAPGGLSTELAEEGSKELLEIEALQLEESLMELNTCDLGALIRTITLISMASCLMSRGKDRKPLFRLQRDVLYFFMDTRTAPPKESLPTTQASGYFAPSMQYDKPSKVKRTFFQSSFLPK